MCTCVPHVFLVPTLAREGIKFPGAGAKSICAIETAGEKSYEQSYSGANSVSHSPGLPGKTRTLVQ